MTLLRTDGKERALVAHAVRFQRLQFAGEFFGRKHSTFPLFERRKTAAVSPNVPTYSGCDSENASVLFQVNACPPSSVSQKSAEVKGGTAASPKNDQLIGFDIARTFELRLPVFDRPEPRLRLRQDFPRGREQRKPPRVHFFVASEPVGTRHP